MTDPYDEDMPALFVLHWFMVKYKTPLICVTTLSS